jgi:uncharacterized protein (TIGR01777 family)
MRVLVTGATGFVGSRLVETLRSDGHRVVTVSRGAKGDYDWSEEGLERGVGAADSIVHLAGENLFGRRWSESQKEVLRKSRVDSTLRLATLAAEKGVGVLISASAVGVYGPHGDEALDESSSLGSDFLAAVCREWEAALRPAVESDTRVSIVRIGVVLGPNGGALQKMLLPFRLGIGGPVGTGRQVVSWIHLDDLVAMIVWLLENGEQSGVFNATAPQPVTMNQWASSLGRTLHRPALLPVPGFVLKLALGEVADVLLTGQRVLPRRASEAGFEFRYPEMSAALEEILAS